MNVLIVTPTDDKRGGVISVADNLARHLEASGHRVLFFHNGPMVWLRKTVTKLGFDGVQLRLCLPFGGGLRAVARTLAFPLLFVTTLVQLLWLLRSRRIQIVNLHYPHDNYLYFAICRRLLPLRLVTSVHGRDAFYKEKPKSHYSRAFRFIIKCSDLVVLPSDTYRRKLVEAFPNVSRRTIFIHNGINPAQFEASEERSVTSGKPRYLLCVAELQEYKAIDILLRAATPLLASDSSLTLVLAGDGPLRGELEALATSLGIRRQTMFLGSQGPFEIARLLRGCEVMVLPSRMEPFGIVLIEAMASKAPVVATDVGGIPEIIQHEVSGILTPSEDPVSLTAALQRVMADDHLRRLIAENGYRRVMASFCASHNGAAYARAFASVLEPEYLTRDTSLEPTARSPRPDASTSPH